MIDVRRDPLPDAVDTVVIGTSPLMLLRACEQARNGRSVLILDRSRIPGGAWNSPPFLGYESVESGVHLIENRRSVYDFLQRFGIELTGNDRHAAGAIGSLAIPLGSARALSFWGVLGKSFIRGDFGNAWKSLPRAIRSSIAFSAGFRYPVGGTNGMVTSILERLREHPVDIRLDCEIDHVRLDSDRPEGICLSSRGDVRFRHLLFSSRAHCMIRRGETALVPKCVSRRIVNLLIRLKTGTIRPISYLEIISDRQLRRARDVTDFVRPSMPSGERMLCLELRGDRSDSEERTVEAALARARRYRLIGPSCEVMETRLVDFDYRTIPERELRRLSESHESLDGVRTTDFAEELVGVLRDLDHVRP